MRFRCGFFVAGSSQKKIQKIKIECLLAVLANELGHEIARKYFVYDAIAVVQVGVNCLIALRFVLLVAATASTSTAIAIVALSLLLLF